MTVMETKSFFWKNEDTAVTSEDENGSPAEGVRVLTLPDKGEVIVRFRNGLLDGDSFTRDGRRITQPAVESEGHVEYWRGGRLHRDSGEAAVAAEGFSVKEYWENNRRIK